MFSSGTPSANGEADRTRGPASGPVFQIARRGRAPMRLIPTRIHGALDDAMGIVLVASPWIFDVRDGGIETWLLVVLSIGMVAYGFLTDYELGLARVIPMPVHLGIDFVAGVLLAASPWLFGFSDEVKWPHPILGLLEIGAVLLSQHHPASEDARTIRPNRRTPQPA